MLLALLIFVIKHGEDFFIQPYVGRLVDGAQRSCIRDDAKLCLLSLLSLLIAMAWR